MIQSRTTNGEAYTEGKCKAFHFASVETGDKYAYFETLWRHLYGKIELKTSEAKTMSEIVELDPKKTWQKHGTINCIQRNL